MATLDDGEGCCFSSVVIAFHLQLTNIIFFTANPSSTRSVCTCAYHGLSLPWLLWNLACKREHMYKFWKPHPGSLSEMFTPAQTLVSTGLMTRTERQNSRATWGWSGVEFTVCMSPASWNPWGIDVSNSLRKQPQLQHRFSFKDWVMLFWIFFAHLGLLGLCRTELAKGSPGFSWKKGCHFYGGGGRSHI